LNKTLHILYFTFSDNIKVKEKVRSKRNKKKQQMDNNKDGQSDFFEDAPPFDENASFYQMNLSRPLLKVKLVIMITLCKFYLHNVHISFSSTSVLFAYLHMGFCALVINIYFNVRLEVFTAVTMKNAVF
jgi:hypothetical protein